MGHYPTRWEDYIGQQAAVRQLMIAARSARARNATMGHVLITSPIAGLGKTTLARLIAAELGGRLLIETEPLKGAAIRMLFLRLKAGDILFLDEIHRQFQGGKGNAEWLLQFLDRGVYPGVRGEQEAPPITLIAATTDVGKLTPPFLRRFPIQAELAPYTDDEAAQIAGKLSAQILETTGLPAPTLPVRAAVARAACNNPGDMSRIVEHLRDLVWSGELTEGTSDGNYPVEEALAMAGFTPDGLTVREVRYLTTLLTEFNGEPAGAQVLRARLGEVQDGLNQVENRLADKGLLMMTKSGRVLSDDGILRTQELLAA